MGDQKLREELEHARRANARLSTTERTMLERAKATDYIEQGAAPQSAEPPASPFPPELVEKAREAWVIADYSETGDEPLLAVLSVVAEWLRSDEELRTRCKRALYDLDYQDAADGYDNEVDAVLAAVLEGRK